MSLEHTTYEQQIAEQARALGPEKQQEVLDFIEFLRAQALPPEGDSPEGELEHLGVRFSEEDLRQARREMWGNFPRDLSN